MAQLTKYTRRELRRIFREAYRELDPDKYENEVDPTRTKDNFNMNPDIKNSYDAMAMLDQRVDEIVETEMGGKPPKNEIKFGSWVITLPKELDVPSTIGREKKPVPMPRGWLFFTTVYDFLEKRYGAENVIDGIVHEDETTPHMTVIVVPECVSRKSGKKSISSATVFSREDLRTFHADLDAAMEAMYGRKNLIQRPEEERKANPKNLTLREYKLALASGAKAEQEARQKADEIIKQAQERADEIIREAEMRATIAERSRRLQELSIPNTARPFAPTPTR